MRRHTLSASLALVLLLPGLARADDVADAMAAATRAYQAGDTGTTRTSLEQALQFLAQHTAAAMGAALPAALPGWQAAEVETNTAGIALLGGGSVASRNYKNSQGQTVQIQVTANSPMITQLAMLMTNPAMAGAMGKLIRVGNQTAIQTSSNEIQMLVDNRILVTISGNAPLDAKQAYTGAIDIAKLTALR